MGADNYTFGFDFGSHLILENASEIDWVAIRDWSLAPRFALIRAHVGAWKDPDYKAVRLACESMGFTIGTWHVLSHDAVKVQVPAWVTEVPEPGPLGRWVDYEEIGSQRRIPTALGLMATMDRLEDHDNAPGKVYTRAGIVNGYLGSIAVNKLNSWYWWLAQYLNLQTIRGEYPPERLTVPLRINREQIVILQTASKLAPPKGAIPHARALDRNRWVGPMSLDEYLEVGPLPPVLTLEERISRLEREARLKGWPI